MKSSEERSRASISRSVAHSRGEISARNAGVKSGVLSAQAGGGHPQASYHPAGHPKDEYHSRLAAHRSSHEALDRRHRAIGNARVWTGLAALAIAAVSIGGSWISPWWLIAPGAVFFLMAVVHSRVERLLDAAARALSYYERALARVENRWIGTGQQGERFRDSKHLYADDLDVFGKGSLFELLSTCRTGAGERFLASWLLEPGEMTQVLERQAAVQELRERIELREDLATMGEEIRAAVDDVALKRWGELPPSRMFPGARVIAPLLACAAVVTFGTFITETSGIIPLLCVIVAEMGFSLLVRQAQERVGEAVGTPARELGLLALLLARLERESFTSPALARLRKSLEADGKLASREIEKLTGLVNQFDQARNMFFAAIAAPLLWKAQFAAAIEAWRERWGPRIGGWTAAVGEFEALCALACFAYERPSAVFPELSDSGDKQYEAKGLAHPLIPEAEAVGNDVALDERMRLWIVSGSNMSGKSTLLRAVGLNAVLGWAGAPVTAKRLRVSRLAIGASLRTIDSLADHRSRFYAEISRLREIMDLARAGKPTLFLLDELLSGTNSHDRRIGAEGLIRGLVERGAIGLVTTHDLALAEIVPSFGGLAANVHFEDHLEGGEILFDYRLREGVVTRSNALELMRAMGLEV